MPTPKKIKDFHPSVYADRHPTPDTWCRNANGDLMTTQQREFFYQKDRKDRKARQAKIEQLEKLAHLAADVGAQPLRVPQPLSKPRHSFFGPFFQPK